MRLGKDEVLGSLPKASSEVSTARDWKRLINASCQECETANNHFGLGSAQLGWELNRKSCSFCTQVTTEAANRCATAPAESADRSKGNVGLRKANCFKRAPPARPSAAFGDCKAPGRFPGFGFWGFSAGLGSLTVNQPCSAPAQPLAGLY